MFSFKVIAVLVLPLSLTAANPLTIRTGSNQCNSGSLNCCEKTDAMSGGGGLLGGLLDGLSIGSGCSPILSILGASSCTEQAVCCTGNSFNGLIAVGCTPINLNL